MPKIVKPPEGYDSWLDYAIDTMDTRSEYLTRLFLDKKENGLDDDEREDMRYSAKIELDELRKKSCSTAS
jgi:hypothetical protein